MIAEIVEAIRAATADPELCATRDEDELLARYAAAGFEVRALEDVGVLVPLRGAAGLARAMRNTRSLTGLRPVFGEFNNWYVTQVAQWSYWTYRERHIRSRIQGRPPLAQ